jgi:Zn-dependent protease
LLFGSVLAHELGHAVVAQRRGIGVRSITLFIFGGVALLEEETEEAGDEFAIAIAGPAVSVAIAIVSAVLGIALWEVSEPVGGILQYLASANALLVLFNLIPAYPLDGGRVLRAFLWQRSGSLNQATRISATIGMLIGYVFIVVGIYTVFGATVSGIWLIAIGWFLRSAAEQATGQVTMQRMFEGVTVGSLMDRQPATVSPDVTIAELVTSYIMARNVHGLPVCNGGRLAGIITLNDVKETPSDEWSRLVVRDRMTGLDELVTATAETDLNHALREMARLDIHQIPVVRDGDLVGLLNRSAVIHFLQLRQALPDASPSQRSVGPLRTTSGRQ